MTKCLFSCLGTAVSTLAYDRLGLETERQEAGGGETLVGRGGWGAACYMFLYLVLCTVPTKNALTQICTKVLELSLLLVIQKRTV